MKSFSISLLLACSMLTSIQNLHADSSQQMTELLKSRLGPQAQVESVSPTAIKGLQQIRFDNRFGYLTEDGRYLIIGDMIDLQTQQNLTEIARRDISREQIEAFPVEQMAVFPATKDRQSVLTIFTDTSCPYCKKIHEEVPQLQQAGIEVRYVPFPRGGARGPGYQTLKQVWCTDSIAKGMDIAKGVISGDLPTSIQCDSARAVDLGYQLGNAVGVSGTPALFTESGRKIEGYVPYRELIPMLLSKGS